MHKNETEDEEDGRDMIQTRERESRNGDEVAEKRIELGGQK